MCSLAFPIIVAHCVKQLRSGNARIVKCFQCRRNVTAVVIKTSSKSLLIVTLNCGIILDEQASKSYPADGLAVSEMVHDLCRAPLSGNRMSSQLIRKETLEAFL